MRLFVAPVAPALLSAADGACADDAGQALIVTESNTAVNQLLFFNSTGALLKSIPTDGQGGVSGNAGGVAASRERIAVFNFGSGTVKVFRRNANDTFYHVERLVQAIGSPVSVAFGNDHLYVLTTTHLESHRIAAAGVDPASDGAAPLLHADGSAAQVGVLDGEVIVTEKSDIIETWRLDARGALLAGLSAVANIPTNANAPFGLVTRGNEAYVTIAHADKISLVRHDAAVTVTVTGSGTQSAPCWVALDGPFLSSANSPSKSPSRYAVNGRQITHEVAVAASFGGNPTDIAYRSGLAAVIDSNGTIAHVSVFSIDEDGNRSLRGVGSLSSKSTNGIAIIGGSDARQGPVGVALSRRLRQASRNGLAPGDYRGVFRRHPAGRGRPPRRLRTAPPPRDRHHRRQARQVHPRRHAGSAGLRTATAVNCGGRGVVTAHHIWWGCPWRVEGSPAPRMQVVDFAQRGVLARELLYITEHNASGDLGSVAS